ncbi:MAG: thermonuclease family protein [Gammaproteobacteria bacterium]|nr:thermonuclease family protein [Gammaproteobacteria bacterium]
MRYPLKGLVFGWLAAAVTVHAATSSVAVDKVGIEDADTLLVDVAGTAYRIQLPDIDAPESVPNPKLQRDVERTGLSTEALTALGRAADAAVEAMLSAGSGHRLQFDPQVRDKYGRTPGDLLLSDGSRLSMQLVEQGYAIPLPVADASRRDALDAAMHAARAAGRGLWGADSANFNAWAGRVP